MSFLSSLALIAALGTSAPQAARTQAAAPPAKPAPAALLSRIAQRIAGEQKALKTAVVTVNGRQEEYDGSGDLEHVNLTVVRVSYEDGKKVETLVKSSLDGKDATAIDRKKMKLASSGKEKETGHRVDNPFLPKEQAGYRFTQLSPDPKHPGLVRIGFSPKGKPSPDVITGSALVDPTTGDLRAMVAHPARNPSHMDDMVMRTEYAYKSPWGLLRSKMTMDGKGTVFFFFHREVKGTVTFSYAFPSQSPQGASEQAAVKPATDAGS